MRRKKAEPAPDPHAFGREAASRAIDKAFEPVRQAAENAAADAVTATASSIAEEVASMVIDSPVFSASVRASAITVASPVGRAATKATYFASGTPMGRVVRDVAGLAAASPVTRRVDRAAKETIGAALVNDATHAALSVVVDAALDAAVDVAIPMLVEAGVNAAFEVAKAGALHGATAVGGGHESITDAVTFATGNPVTTGAQRFFVKAVSLTARRAAAIVVAPILGRAAEKARGEIVRKVTGDVIVDIPVAMSNAVLVTIGDVIEANGKSRAEIELLLSEAAAHAVADVVRSGVRPVAGMVARDVLTGSVVTAAVKAAVREAIEAIKSTTHAASGAPGRFRQWLTRRNDD
ncbi:hypothetical protein [Hoyosella altamirensis]|uniref:Uncharacterized protein n=1 Tax=Hoyosella altamirensis TaxID=616997 RepID=A0A839RJW0_9ACTN|nr:hypothetical protein [Hoyosella altamirensis]MBB3036518.1 hypothetical protein [Hoyosella altamirensis]